MPSKDITGDEIKIIVETEPRLSFSPQDKEEKGGRDDATSVDSSSSHTSSGIDSVGSDVRETWSGGCDFIMSCIGYAVGLGNIWRFPYLCYENGGGAFLVPYLLFAVLVAVPLFFMEISFGQFASLSPITIWRISPLFKGLGYGMVIVSFQVCIYYNVILAWNFYYMFLSFYPDLAWTNCANEWNTDCCKEDRLAPPHVNCLTNSTTTPAEEFFDRRVLRRSTGIEDPGGMVWPLFGYLALAWFVVFLCIFKGIRSTGKIVYVTAMFPYVILTALLIRGLTLDGAIDGILFYIKPDFEHLGDIKIWNQAAQQIFYSMGAAWGVLITMSSFNKFNNNTFKDSMIVPTVNCLSSVFAGFVIFSILGFMAKNAGVAVKDVVNSGVGLAFIAYPEAASKLPWANMWCFLFFMMILTLGLDSQFSMFETITSAIVDEFPQYRKQKLRIIVTVILLQFFLGCLLVTKNGVYVFTLINNYSGTFSVQAIGFFELVVISWIYGIDRFCLDIEMMIGRKPPIFFKYMWKYITPAATFIIYIIGLSQTGVVTYIHPKSNEEPTGIYYYPAWGVAVGLFIALVSLVPIPLVAGIAIWNTDGPIWKRIKMLSMPTIAYGPILAEHYDMYVSSLTPSQLQRSHYIENKRIGATEIEKTSYKIREQRESIKASSRGSAKVEYVTPPGDIPDVVLQAGSSRPESEDGANVSLLDPKSKLEGSNVSSQASSIRG